TNLGLDDTGYTSGQKKWFEHRLRLTPKIVEIGDNDAIEIQASFDLLAGQIAGDVANDFRGYGLVERSEQTGLKAEGFDFRYLFARGRMPVGLIQLGQMPMQWGMGMVVNNGNGENTTDFGDPKFGDIIEGVLFATRPLVGVLGPKSEFGRQIALALEAGAIYRD